MPFTPFHFGPGAVFHAIAPKKISFIGFCAVNVLIDVETLYFMVNHQPPLHRFFHTFVGATLAFFCTVILFIVGRRLAGRFWLPNWFGWQRLDVGAVAIGGAIGAWSHVILDGIMHGDTRPFAPFSKHNPIYQWVDLSTLHQVCVALGALGIGVLGWRYWKRKGTDVK